MHNKTVQLFGRRTKALARELSSTPKVGKINQLYPDRIISIATELIAREAKNTKHGKQFPRFRQQLEKILMRAERIEQRDSDLRLTLERQFNLSPYNAAILCGNYKQLRKVIVNAVKQRLEIQADKN
jgi:two-component sensor histidine kinase